MRKIAILAMLAIVAAMVPLSTASSQQSSVGTQTDGAGTLVLINPSGATVDVFVSDNNSSFSKVLDNFPSPRQEELQLPVGTRTIVVCTSSAGEDGCGGGTQLSSTTFNMGENDQKTGYISSLGGFAVTIFNEDTDNTEIDHTRFTAENAVVPAAVTVCIDGNILGPLAAGQQGVAENVKSDLNVPFFVYIGVPVTTCGQPGFSNDPSDPTIDLAPGTNLIAGTTTNADCIAACGHQIYVGEEHTDGKGSPAFCEALLGAQGITAILDATFAEVEVGRVNTYPGPNTVQDALEQIGEILERGNETAPPEIRDAWYTVTGNFGRLVAELAATGYDLKDIAQSSLRLLIAGVEHPPADDEDAIAATDALTAWYATNCVGAITAEPTFTG